MTAPRGGRRRKGPPPSTPEERRAREAEALAASLQVSATGEGEEQVLTALARLLVALLRQEERREGPSKAA